MNNTEYWKGRMISKLKSIRKQLNLDSEGLLAWAGHIKLETKKIKSLMNDIGIKFEKLEEAIKNETTKV